jgi:hypothetical protein
MKNPPTLSILDYNLIKTFITRMQLEAVIHHANTKVGALPLSFPRSVKSPDFKNENKQPRPLSIFILLFQTGAFNIKFFQ